MHTRYGRQYEHVIVTVIGRIAAVAILLTQVLPVKSFDVSTCGQSKACFLVPDSCTNTTCTAAVTWYRPAGADHVVLELFGRDGWVAVGLSRDASMGDDSVSLCIKNANTNQLAVLQAYNQGYAGPINLSPSNTGISVLSTSSVGGTIYCQFTRQLTVSGNSQFFDAQQAYYLLLAYGAVSSGDTPRRHSFNPARSSQKQTLAAFTIATTSSSTSNTTPVTTTSTASRTTTTTTSTANPTTTTTTTTQSPTTIFSTPKPTTTSITTTTTSTSTTTIFTPKPTTTASTTNPTTSTSTTTTSSPKSNTTTFTSTTTTYSTKPTITTSTPSSTTIKITKQTTVATTFDTIPATMPVPVSTASLNMATATSIVILFVCLALV